MIINDRGECVRIRASFKDALSDAPNEYALLIWV